MPGALCSRALVLSEWHRDRVALREGTENPTIPGVRRLREDFPTVAQHLGDVVVHFVQVEQPALVVRREDTLLICEGLRPFDPCGPCDHL